MDEKITPAQAMRLAIREARLGTGRVTPNPLVGCTILDAESKLLAVGYHAKLGHDHAEISAIKRLSNANQVTGSHIYVTLEPCAHQGRTPSCARTLAQLKPASVTYAVEDPNPLVSGKGAQILREAGVKVHLFGVRSDVSLEDRDTVTCEAEDLAEIFLHNQRGQRPFVAVKVASTLDGQIALSSGESKWITSDAAREHAHRIRARYDAVAVGVQTLLIDNPSLNIRDPAYADLTNRAIVFDPRGRGLEFLRSASLTSCRPARQVIAVVGANVKIPSGLDVTILESRVDSEGRFTLADVLSKLSSCGVTSVMIEGGANLVASFFSSRLVDRLHLYQAPLIFGGSGALGWSSGFGITKIDEAAHLSRCEFKQVGPDIYWTGRVAF